MVFDVSLEGRARKVVTLRSALMIKNKMDLPVEIKLQGLTSLHGKFIQFGFYDCIYGTRVLLFSILTQMLLSSEKLKASFLSFLSSLIIHKPIDLSNGR